MDYENGNDAVRATLADVVFSLSGVDDVLGTKAGHGLVTGACITVSGCTQAYANSVWKITLVNADTFTLDGASWTSFNGADVTGNAVPFGGMNWADAWKTVTSGATAARIAPGDIIRIAKSPAPTSLGTGEWTNLSKTVTLGAAQTLNIDLCEEAWTASANVTATTSTTRKQGANSASLAIAAAFTTGKVAYKAITSINLSAYQKISFWFRNNVAIAAGNILKVCLCSDAAGDTIVDTFWIPAIPSTNRFLPLTLTKDGGGNLGAAIQSIAIYADSDPGTPTILIDDIIACTTNGLNLQSLISKNSAEQGGTEGWYGIQSIDGVTVLLDNGTETLANAGRGYGGTTETVTTYKRETIKTALSLDQEIQDSGTSGNNIQFQGGYNTATNVQDGETFFDGLNGYGYGLYLYGKSWITLNYLNFSRYSYGVYYRNSNNNSITTLSNANNNTNYGVYYYSDSHNNSITTLSNANNNGYGVYYYSSHNNSITTLSNANNNYNGVHYINSNNNSITTLSNVNNNSNCGVYYSGCYNSLISNLSNANNNTNYGVYYTNSYNSNIRTLSTSGNGTAGVFNNVGRNYLFNALIAEATEVTGFTDFINARIFSGKHDQTLNNHKIFTDGGTIRSEATIRHTDSGIAWRLDPTSTNRSSSYPLDLSIAKVAVGANALVTIKAWFRRSNTGITGKLVCKGRQIAGVDDDVTASITAAADTWQELNISFTSSEAGVVEIEAYAYGGTTYTVFVDDLTISQA
ncbi:MAG: right-handed parallel beta-helix repeat-containing protein [Bacteroidales bacterium]|jgi:hypothetical protein